MTSFLRPLAYRHRWIYDSVTAVSSLSVGGVGRLRGLGLDALSHRLEPNAEILDLCCGSGEAAAPWISAGYAVTGLDVSPRALDLAAERHPLMQRVEGLAEAPPLKDQSFNAIQLSVALHEFPRAERELVLSSALRLLKSGRLVGGGGLCIRRLRSCAFPSELFCALFETETATAMLEDDLPAQLSALGFFHVEQELMAGRALQRITAQRP